MRWRSPISRPWWLLDARIDETGGPPDGPVEDLGAYRAEIDQAGGMLTVQLGVGIEEAFVRLRAYAWPVGFVSHRTRSRTTGKDT
ncbi:ANTAR domain-containing protein [Streptomyces sp. NPDC001663]|uniref:ANTAR domain-containing protein n=1 Tax=Streptomyces sp. NPDC001663 TaxID=3364597 RepID=UPI00367FD47A